MTNVNTVSDSELKARLEQVKSLQTKGTSSGGGFATNKVLAYLRVNGFILSNNPLLAEVNPKYPTDAVWTAIAKNMAEPLAAEGLYIKATGRKPTRYELLAIPGITPAVAPKVDTSKGKGTQVSA